LIRGDLADYSILTNATSNIDIIFHLAAIPGVRISIQNAPKVTKNNILSTVNVFEKALKSDVEKVVIASSSSVYGNPIYTPVDENHPKSPISPYAVSKLCCEMYADYYFREYNLPVTSLRFYTVYGPRGRPDMAIRIFFSKIMKNDPIKIFGDGSQIRDFTYISDIVDGLILASEIKQSSGEIFNLGCSNPIELNQLIEKIYEIADRPRNTQYLEKQQGDVKITSSKIDKARKILGFDPKVNIDEGLKKTYEWQKENLK
ncbi:MAG: NAD-dependent epimerase/dehydratase family protein, partial [Candidatus Lokiarchaeota archaeon]|nr:NAD-dependent epimerase/dehydratase family protein [Candidatus Lokiarchaeota archaeon]